MPRKKEQPKPILAFKHDFYASLDHVLQMAMNLEIALSVALDNGMVDERVAPKLREHLDALHHSIFSGEEC